MSIIEPNLFQPFAKTILVISITDSKLSQLSINHLFTKTSPTYLHTLHCTNNNFGNTITNETFTGFLSICRLFLENCQITSIGAGTFDSMPESLSELSLAGNRLKILPGNIFGRLQYFQVLKIWLSYNDWHCDCRLEYLRIAMVNNGLIYRDAYQVICRSPNHYRDMPIIQIQDLCYSVNVQESQNIEQYQKKMNEKNIMEMYNLIELTCNKNSNESQFTKMLLIPQKTGKFRVSYSANGVVMQVSNFSSNWVVIGYDASNPHSDQQINHETHCVKNDRKDIDKSTSFKPKIQPNRLYQYCMSLKKEVSTIFSPLDCIVFRTRPVKIIPWILKKHKPIVISLAIISGIIAFLFSGFFAVFIAGQFPFLCGKNFVKKRQFGRKCNTKPIRTM